MSEMSLTSVYLDDQNIHKVYILTYNNTNKTVTFTASDNTFTITQNDLVELKNKQKVLLINNSAYLLNYNITDKKWILVSADKKQNVNISPGTPRIQAHTPRKPSPQTSLSRISSISSVQEELNMGQLNNSLEDGKKYPQLIYINGDTWIKQNLTNYTLDYKLYQKGCYC